MLARSEPIEARVRAVVIVVVVPCRNQMAGTAQGREQVLVLAFISQAAIESFHEAAPHGFSEIPRREGQFLHFARRTMSEGRFDARR